MVASSSRLGMLEEGQTCSCLYTTLGQGAQPAIHASSHIPCAPLQINLHITEQQRVAELPDDVAAPSHPR